MFYGGCDPHLAKQGIIAGTEQNKKVNKEKVKDITMIKNERTVILIMAIMFVIAFTASIIFGLLFDNMVLASAPVVLFWLYVMNKMFSNMEEF